MKLPRLLVVLALTLVFASDALLPSSPVMAAIATRLSAPNQFNDLAGDSWTLDNEAVRSRFPQPGNIACTTNPCNAIFGITVPSDGWVYQAGPLTGLYITNRGVGSQTSGTIYNQVLAAIAAAPLIQWHNWTWLLGRNDAAKPGGLNLPAVTDGTYTTAITATLTNGSSAVTSISPSLATAPGGTIEGCNLSGTAGLPTGANLTGTGTSGTLSGYSAGANVTQNFTGTTGSKALTLTCNGAVGFLAAIPHGRKLLILPYYGSPVGNVNWSLWQQLKWIYRRTHRQYLFELPAYWMAVSPNGALAGGSEDQNVANEDIPPSEAYNSHPNYIATPHFSAEISKTLLAMANRRVYALAASIPDVPYNAANGAVLGQLYGYGNITSWSLISDDCSGCVAVASNGQITRTASGSLLSVVNLTVQASGLNYLGGAVTHQNSVRLLPSLVGSGSTTPVGATLTLDANAYANKGWPKGDLPSATMANSTKFTFGICFKPSSTNAFSFIDDSSGNNAYFFNTNGSSRMQALLRDTVGTTIFNFQSNTQVTYDTTKYHCALISADTGTTSFSAWGYDSTAGEKDIGAGNIPTFTGNGTFNFAQIPGLFNSSMAGSAKFGGGVKFIFLKVGVFTDFSVAGNRRLFYDASGNPAAVGCKCATPAGASADICMMGAAGDWVTGKNYGTAGDFSMNDPWLRGLAYTEPAAP